MTRLEAFIRKPSSHPNGGGKMNGEGEEKCESSRNSKVLRMWQENGSVLIIYFACFPGCITWRRHSNRIASLQPSPPVFLFSFSFPFDDLQAKWSCRTCTNHKNSFMDRKHLGGSEIKLQTGSPHSLANSVIPPTNNIWMNKSGALSFCLRYLKVCRWVT